MVVSMSVTIVSLMPRSTFQSVDHWHTARIEFITLSLTMLEITMPPGHVYLYFGGKIQSIYVLYVVKCTVEIQR